jgi:hypothetical protein
MNEFNSYPQDEYDYPPVKCDWLTIVTVVTWLIFAAEITWCNLH